MISIWAAIATIRHVQVEQKRRARTVVIGSVGDSISAGAGEAAGVVSGTGPVTTNSDVEDD